MGTCLQLAGAEDIEVCDNGEGDADPTEGVIELDTVPAGTYTADVIPPEGYELASALSDVSVVGDDISSLDVSMRQVETAGPTPTEAALGVLFVVVTLEDGATPVGSICLRFSGPTVLDVCDNSEGDVDPTEGAVEIDTAPVGEYTVELIDQNEYELLTENATISIKPDAVESLNLTVRAVAAVEPTETEQAFGVLFLQAVLKDEVTPLGGLCLTLTGPTTVEICDNAEGDVDPTEGVIEVISVPVGDYAIEVSPPADHQLAGDLPPIRIEEGAVATRTLTFRTDVVPTVPPTEETVPEAPTEPPTVAPTATSTETPTEIPTPVLASLIIRTFSEDGMPLPGACYTATGSDGSVLSACDEHTTGEVRLDGATPGTWTIEETVAPDGYGPGEPQVVEVPEGGETVVEITNPALELPPGSLAARAFDQDGGLIPGGCYVAVGPDGAAAAVCDDNLDGVADLGSQPPGDWTVWQVQPPPGFLRPDSRDLLIHVESDQSTEAMFTNQRADPASRPLPPAVPSPSRVNLIGNFQDEIGCPADFDPECGLTSLVETGVSWIGSFVIPDGIYSARIVIDGDSSWALGLGGWPDGEDVPVVVPAGTASVFVSYDPSTGTIVILPSPIRVQLATDIGVFELRPLEHDLYEAYLDLPAGSNRLSVLIDGQSVLEDTVTLDSDSRIHLVVDSSGIPVVFETIQSARLMVTKVDDSGIPVVGSCFAVISFDGSLIGQACDHEGSGTTVIQFPNGVAAGEYLLKETASAEGAAAVPDQTVLLSEGDNAVQVGPWAGQSTPIQRPV